jgi:hypothetical protein
MNQVTEKKNGALATFDMEADAQQQNLNISQEDQALPFLKILGQLSPEVNKRDGKYVEGAEPGKIFNTVTSKLYDTIDVIPCYYKRQYIEWQDRGVTGGGAPVASHIYTLKTVQMSNDKGTWFGWEVLKKGPVGDKSLYEMSKAFSLSVGKGEITTKTEVQEQTKKSLNL